MSSMMHEAMVREAVVEDGLLMQLRQEVEEGRRSAEDSGEFNDDWFNRVRVPRIVVVR